MSRAIRICQASQMPSIDGGSVIVVSSGSSTGSGTRAPRRYRSIAARRAMVNSHGASGRPGSSDPQARQAFRKVTWTASAASSRSPRILSAIVNTAPE